MDNRIENNLKEVSKTELVDLSVGGKAFALDEFVEKQEKCIKEKSKGLKAKNMEVEHIGSGFLSFFGFISFLSLVS